MHDVFISYSSKDQDVTEQIRQALETNGISCWIAPRNIPLGSSYAREIPAAIRGCTELYFFRILCPTTGKPFMSELHPLASL